LPTSECVTFADDFILLDFYPYWDWESHLDLNIQKEVVMASLSVHHNSWVEGLVKAI
jgi:hypothetical protein